MIKGIIFDMDGVLIDSVDINIFSHKKYFAKFGINHSAEDEDFTLGMSMKDKFRIWGRKNPKIKNIKIDDFISETTKTQLDEFEKRAKRGDYRNEGLNNLISEVRRAGVKIAVATSSPRIRAIPILQIIEIYNKINVLVSSDDIARSKPDPHIYLTAAQKLGENPRECIVFEDSFSGIIAAKKANMKCIAMRTKHEAEKDLMQADKIIDSFSDITLKDLNRM